LAPPVGWVSGHPEITPPSNFHHLRDTTIAKAGNRYLLRLWFSMECWLWLTLGAAFRSSRRTEKPGPDEIELCPAVHLPLDERELGDVTLGLSVGPWQRQSRPNSRLIVAEATGE
jgi:hypothetical protein